MPDLHRVQERAHQLIAHHLDNAVWSFGFDNAKMRAGQCDYTRRRITVSRHLAVLYDEDEITQVLLHEIAHAIAGSAAGHGPRWRKIAAELGYTGGRVHPHSAAESLAPWLGLCPSGHAHYRFRRPARTLSCGQCSRRFAREHVIRWNKRADTSVS